MCRFPELLALLELDRNAEDWPAVEDTAERLDVR